MSDDFVVIEDDLDFEKDDLEHSTNNPDYEYDNVDDNSLHYPLFLLGNENRYTIIKELYDNCYTLTDLSKKVLNQEKAEVNKIQKPVELLLKKHLISKNGEGKICITNLGRRLFEMVDPIITIWKQRDYFTKHRIQEPFSLVLSGKLLKAIKVIEGYPAILRKIIEMYTRADTYLYNILYEVHYNKEILEVLNEKLDKNKNFITKTIFGKNSIRDPDWINRYQIFNKYKQIGKIEQRMIEKIHVSLILTDNEALIFFPIEPFISKELKPDTQSALYFKDDKYLQLCCLDYFKLLWVDSKSFDHAMISDANS